MSKLQIRRKFNGKEFEHTHWARTKTSARNKARRLRKKGFYVRIIPHRAKRLGRGRYTVHDVYTRKRRR